MLRRGKDTHLPLQVGLHLKPLRAVHLVLRYLHVVLESQRKLHRISWVECTCWSDCHFPRFHTAYIRKGATCYHQGDESEVTEGIAICECVVIDLFLLLIEEKCPGRKMDSQGHRHVYHFSQVGIDTLDIPSFDWDGA